MTRSTVGGRLLETLLFAVSSLLLYSFGVGRLLFLVPLQVIAVRRGASGLASAGALATVALAAMRLAALLPAPLEASGLVVAVAEVAAFLLLAAGLGVANLRMGGARALLRLLGATAAVCLAGAPLAAAAAANPAVTGMVDELFADVSRVLKSIFTTGDSVAGTVIEAMIVPETLKAMVRESLLSSFVVSVFALLAFSWWAGSAAGSRATFPHTPRWRFAAFRLEGWWLWPLIGSLALAAAELLGLAEHVPDSWSGFASSASYGVWNAVLLVLFLFGLQGLAIVRSWLEKRAIARFVWPLAVVAVLGALVTPRLNVVVAVGLPLFGASENWVRYRATPATPA